jgi:hypothetical protein
MRAITIIIPWAAAVLALTACPLASGGPYSAALNDPDNPFDAPVPGFTGPHGAGKARLVTGLDDEGEPLLVNPGNFVHPLFFAWADEVADHVPSEFVTADFNDPLFALGPVTGDNFHVVSLGDMTAAQIDNGDPPGTITVRFAKPIRDLTGADFVVFENALIAESNESGAVAGQVFGELAYVEVSADGENFTRFPAESLIAAAVGGYGSINATDLRNLAGKHNNAGGESWGTPFDLAQLGISEIQYIRLVDIPGSGAFTDHAGRPIYDPWKTFGSGGFDLEAVGAISIGMTYGEWPQLETLAADKRGEADDEDGDGIANLLEYAFGRLPGFPEGGENLPLCRMIDVDGQAHGAIEFVRDERLTDLVYEVQVSPSLAESGWTTIALSSGGGAVQAADGHNPVISETSASPLASIGVLRKVSVRETLSAAVNPRRFFRVKVSISSTPGS